MLLATWFDEPHRATRDVDLLGFEDAADGAPLGTFREIMAVEVDDRVSFDIKGLRIEAIREEVEYGGSRLRTTAALTGARIPITVDIGFGEAVEPGVQDIDLPVVQRDAASKSRRRCVKSQPLLPLQPEPFDQHRQDAGKSARTLS